MNLDDVFKNFSKIVYFSKISYSWSIATTIIEMLLNQILLRNVIEDFHRRESEKNYNLKKNPSLSRAFK